MPFPTSGGVPNELADIDYLDSSGNRFILLLTIQSGDK
jgi:hypothetical protein